MYIYIYICSATIWQRCGGGGGGGICNIKPSSTDTFRVESTDGACGYIILILFISIYMYVYMYRHVYLERGRRRKSDGLVTLYVVTRARCSQKIS